MELFRLEGAEQFKPKIIDLFANARYEASIVSSLHPPFYNDAEVKKALTSCIEKVKKIRLLIDDGKNIEKIKSELPWLIELKKKYPNKMDIRFIEDPDLKHIMIIDNQNLRIEEPHEDNTTDKTKNLIIKGAPESMIDAANELFDSWWKSGKELDTKQKKISEFPQNTPN